MTPANIWTEDRWGRSGRPRTPDFHPLTVEELISLLNDLSEEQRHYEVWIEADPATYAASVRIDNGETRIWIL